MTDVFLGVIAFATLIMAAVQIGGIVYAGRVAGRIEALLGRLERELGPVMARLREVGDEAARASVLAVAQLERADRLFADVAARVETTLELLQQAIVAPAREGLAALSAFRAVFAALRGRGSKRHAGEPESEDALFIG